MILRRLGLLLCFLPAFASADYFYRVKPEIGSLSLLVELNLDESEEKQKFRIPAWSPGFYSLLNYHKKVFDVSAYEEDDKPLKVVADGTGGWIVENPDRGELKLRYSVKGDDSGLGFFGVCVRPRTTFINGPAAFMYPENRLNEDILVHFDIPEKWQIATGLTQETDDAYSAENYDELIDCPVELGIFERHRFEVQGIPFEAVFVSPDGTYNVPMEEITKMLKQVSQPALKMFGGAPFKKFLYLFHLLPGDFDGGLEHRNSTVITLTNGMYNDVSDLASHEFFHAWNVKQIRPKVLGPFDYTGIVRTKNLWFSEGVTDYYGFLHVYQSKYHNIQWLLESFTANITEIESSEVRKEKTIEEVSQEAWENGGYGNVGDLSYYTMGFVIGLLLDAEIRNVTDGKKSLNSVMRLLYQRHRLPNPGFGEDDLRKTINEVAGKDLSAFYDRMVRSTHPINYNPLRSIGLVLTKPGDVHFALGLNLQGNKVTGIQPELKKYGVKVGDLILTINKKPFAPGVWSVVKPGSKYEMIVQRGKEKFTLSMRMIAIRVEGYNVWFDTFATARAIRLRQAWLAGN